MNIYPNAILVYMSLSFPFVQLQTLDRAHGKSERFYLHVETIRNIVSGDVKDAITETDLTHYATVYGNKSSVSFRVSWLRSSWDGSLNGYEQRFTVPMAKVADVLRGKSIRHFSCQPLLLEKANILFTRTAHEAIGEAAANKLLRHAVRKFFRDHLNYGSEEQLIIQRDEWVRGFFFYSKTPRYEGGIALHESQVRGRNGRQYQKLAFSVHT